MKKLISGISALAMLTAMTVPFSAFAEETKSITTNGGSDTTEVSYDVQAKYTVTIPAGVELSNTEKKSKSITASDVMLKSGQKIIVKLTGASNTKSGTTFNAKNGSSTATYTIIAGEVEVAVGDTVAEFTADGSQSLTFSTATGETYAGKHTETLTFGISVESTAVAPKYSDIAVAFTDFEKTYLDTGVVSQTEGYIGQPLTLEEATALSEYFSSTTGKKAVVIYDAVVRTNPEWSRVVFVKDGTSNDSNYMDGEIKYSLSNEYVLYYVPKQ